ncbi:hemolysin-activating lysine-acyltransferase HlyC, partial [Morganella morganii]
IYKNMRKNNPNDFCRAIRGDPETQVGKVSEYHGGKIDKKLANKIFKQYHHELIKKVKNKPDFKFSLIS